MRALVTGGAGFIGSHVVDALLARGDSVTIVDNFDPDYPASVKNHNIAAHKGNQRCSVLDADIRFGLPTKWLTFIGTHDVIVHLAAKAGVLPSIQDPIGTYTTNVNGTLSILEYARRAGICKMVFASSSSVYGGTTKFPSEETDALNPISPYASTKLAGEHLCALYAHLHGIHSVALRFFTVYGPRQRPDLAIHKFAKAMVSGQPVTLYGDGSSTRDYTYISDIVDGILKAIDYDATPFEIVNLGSGNPVRLSWMVDTLASAMHIEPRIEHLPVQAGDPPATWADISKAQQILGWAPVTDFEEGTRRFVDWLKTEALQDAA